MRSDSSCSCFGRRRFKEKDIECLRAIAKHIMKSYIKSTGYSEHIIGYEDMPVYIQTNNIIQFGGRTERFYYME